jgi:hypothetical protein
MYDLFKITYSARIVIKMFHTEKTAFHEQKRGIREVLRKTALSPYYFAGVSGGAAGSALSSREERPRIRLRCPLLTPVGTLLFRGRERAREAKNDHLRSLKSSH